MSLLQVVGVGGQWYLGHQRMGVWDEAYLHNLLEYPGIQGQVSLIGDLTGGSCVN